MAVTMDGDALFFWWSVRIALKDVSLILVSGDAGWGWSVSCVCVCVRSEVHSSGPVYMSSFFLSIIIHILLLSPLLSVSQSIPRVCVCVCVCVYLVVIYIIKVMYVQLDYYPVCY